MIRHIALFKLRPDLTEIQRQNFVLEITKFFALYKEYLSSNHGADIEIQNGNYEYAICVDFKDQAQYEQYAQDPAHIRLIKEHIQGAIIARAATQINISE